MTEQTRASLELLRTHQDEDEEAPSCVSVSHVYLKAVLPSIIHIELPTGHV